MLRQIGKFKELQVIYRQNRLFSQHNINKEDNKSTSNPYFNPTAAYLKNEMNTTEDAIRNWQLDFKAKHGRKPTLEEMKKDSTIGHLFEERKTQKNSLQKEMSQLSRFRQSEK